MTLRAGSNGVYDMRQLGLSAGTLVRLPPTDSRDH